MTIPPIDHSELCATYTKMYHAISFGANTGVTGTQEELNALREKIETLVPQFDLDPFYSPGMYSAAKPADTLPRRRERVSLLSQRRVDVLSRDFKESSIRVRRAALEDDPIRLHDRYIKIYHANAHGANTGLTGTSRDLRNLKRQILELAPHIEWEWEPTYDPARYPPLTVKDQESTLKKFARANLELLGIDLSKNPALSKVGNYQEIVEKFFKDYSSKTCTPNVVITKTGKTLCCLCTLSCDRVVISNHQSSSFSIAEVEKALETVAKAYQNAHDYIEKLLSQYFQKTR